MAIEETRTIVSVRATWRTPDKEVNDYLTLGWVLLGVFTQSSNDGEGWAGAVFTLGWQGQEPPVHPPDSFHVKYGVH